MAVEEVLVVLLHDVPDLVEVFLGQLVRSLENVLYLIVNGIERVEVFFLEVPLLGLISEEGYLIGYLLVVLY